MTFTTASVSRIGRRSRNEDRYGEVAPARGPLWGWVVADGVGGQPGGAVAAQRAADAALAVIADAEELGGAVQRALEAAQSAVAAARDGENAEMATTIVLLASDGTSVAWGHVGDSRLYRVRDDGCAVLTRDHSLVAALRSLGTVRGAGDEPAHGNTLLSSIGPDDPAYAVADPEPLAAGDAFLLCSDGLWAHVAPAAVAHALRESASAQDWIERLTRRVEDAADAQQDNYTGVAVTTPRAAPAASPRASFLRRWFPRR